MMARWNGNPCGVFEIEEGGKPRGAEKAVSCPPPAQFHLVVLAGVEKSI